jgi:hypothetical protein
VTSLSLAIPTRTPCGSSLWTDLVRPSPPALVRLQHSNHVLPEGLLDVVLGKAVSAELLRDERELGDVVETARARGDAVEVAAEASMSTPATFAMCSM